MLLKMRKRLYIKEGILTQVMFVRCAIHRIMILLSNIDENEEVLNRYCDDNNSDDTDSEIISGMQQRDLL